MTSGRRVAVIGRLLDPERGAPLGRRAVVVAGGLVEAVCAVDEVGSSVEVIDCGDLTVMPGLIDCHQHLMRRYDGQVTEPQIAAGTVDGVVNAMNLLRDGITTARDLGCPNRGIHGLRAAIDAGEIPGPRLRIVGGPVPVGRAAPGWWRGALVDGPDDMRRAVREELALGADVVKVVISHAPPVEQFRRTIQYLGGDEVQAAAVEARAHSVPSTCHCEGQVAAGVAIDAGLDCIEHGTSLDDRQAAAMAERGIALVPTAHEFFDAGNHPTATATALADCVEEHRASMRRAVAAGVTIGAGTDSTVGVPPRQAIVRELQALCEGGLTTAHALRSATVDAARIVGLEGRIGVLRPGAVADLIAVSGAPLEDLTALTQPPFVMQGGTVVVDLDGRAAPIPGT